MLSEKIFPTSYPNFEQFGETPCSQEDPDAFFPMDLPDGQLKKVTVYLDEQGAKAVCRSCPYLMDCASYAIKDPEIQGIWGATTERDRAAIRRGRGVKIQIELGMTPSRRR